ncbi:hypothetical protein L596_019865 [Steinernema carpocapsae]|uniref:RRM domain-containing protein n=1 Tax=Steinernema carpocapsae TaxID=34508 RepID=A0A4U5MS20_STECR|nr:hypothetical protein L596_019865 [Steinernema carpocapsae]
MCTFSSLDETTKKTCGTEGKFAHRRGLGNPQRRHFQKFQNPSNGVKLVVNNLASSVTRADLKELFAPYHPTRLFTHFGQNGSILSADVFLSPGDSSKLCFELQGLALDGRELKIILGKKPSMEDRMRKAASKMQWSKKPTSGAISKKPFERKNYCKRHVSSEDLDQELAAYLTKSKAAKDSEEPAKETEPKKEVQAKKPFFDIDLMEMRAKTLLVELEAIKTKVLEVAEAENQPKDNSVSNGMEVDNA